MLASPTPSVPHSVGLIDTHCHLEEADFRTADGADGRAEVLARAAAAGVVQLIVVGSGHGLAEADNAVALARAHRHLFAAVGIHPHDASAVMAARPPARGGPTGEALWQAVERLCWQEPKVVCVGETGLDYHYRHSPPEEQQALLRRFLRLSAACGKPVSLHVRDAHEDARRIVVEEGVTAGVVHCFTGTADDARAWLDLGFFISFSGIVTFRTASAIQEAARLVPPERLLLETDSPYLSPVPLRGRRNEPAHLCHTAAFVAALRGVTVEELARQTSAAARALFRLPASE
ncbi:MAG: TatD family hydrolase [Myxococcales bacterium]|nr:TatD family hydrolase [Myxococcota bacterium]MDW8283064.1 TatD family hydrolase [Myxococcales bacterium]